MKIAVEVRRLGFVEGVVELEPDEVEEYEALSENLRRSFLENIAWEWACTEDDWDHERSSIDVWELED